MLDLKSVNYYKIVLELRSVVLGLRSVVFIDTWIHMDTWIQTYFCPGVDTVPSESVLQMYLYLFCYADLQI